MTAPTLAQQLAAVEACIKTQRETLQLIATLGCPGVPTDRNVLRAEYERRIACLEAAVQTLRASARPAPPQRAAS